MPSLKSIRRRIASVKNTQKITRAMKMVAAARLKRAQQRIVELRPYALKTTEVLRSVAPPAAPTPEAAADDDLHPLLKTRPVERVLYLIFTSDRGLAGAFNSSILRATDRALREEDAAGRAVALALVGRKGRDYFKRRRLAQLRHDLVGAYEGGAQRAAEIARTLIGDFTADDRAQRVDRVVVVFNEFKSAIAQKVTFLQVLPIDPSPGTSSAGAATASEPQSPPPPKAEHLYEPSQAALLDRLLPMYVEVTVYRAMLESVASEQGARMTAMDSATKNAKKIIDKLTLQYNRTRQAMITKELMEIIGGAEALKD
ncbi:MAG: ATP synthase F1 subunit gamma [Deltaproteobacteria bacterium]|nr:ATP synthase F1 subunit gamma [Deltaproteobacteria bacterium]